MPRRPTLDEKLTPEKRKELLRWAEQALHGLDESHVFLGVMDDKPLDAARVEWLIQLGHAVMHDKPIILPVPYGIEVPKKLAAVADAIVRYHIADPSSIQDGLVKALTELGIKPH